MYAQAIWKAVAFAGRYGGQPAQTMLDLTSADITEFNRSLAELIQQESDAAREAASRGR